MHSSGGLRLGDQAGRPQGAYGLPALAEPPQGLVQGSNCSMGCLLLPQASSHPLPPFLSMSLPFLPPLCCRRGAGGYENELRAQETVIIC